MERLATGLLALVCVAGSSISAQETASGFECTKPDSIAIKGLSRVADSTVKFTLGWAPKMNLTYPEVQSAIQRLFSTGQFDDVKVLCSVPPVSPNVLVTVELKERPLLTGTEVKGATVIPLKDLKEKLTLPTDVPVDPSKITAALRLVDSMYESKGFYTARVRLDSSVAAGRLWITFNIEEGRRIAVAGVRVFGNKAVSAKDVVGAMKTKPEGFLWIRKGELNDVTYSEDRADRIPQLYASRGYIDMRIVKDTIIVDSARAKAFIELTVHEGPRYLVGSFEVFGNRLASTEAISRFFPFEPTSVRSRQTFDQVAWQDARRKLEEGLQNQGFAYARVEPREDRVSTDDSVRVVNLRWEVTEGPPAYVRRVNIVGNDFTHESCIRHQIWMVPGAQFERAALLRSYQNLSNLGFFETPLSEPKIDTDAETGDMDITFILKEKRTGTINFGASMGQGTGLGGFIGFDQPNLFGLCKRGALQWQFGNYINDFNLTYGDPNIRQSLVSGQVSLYHTFSRYQIADLGQSIRTGGSLQIGFPVPGSQATRLYFTYSGEKVRYGGDANSLLNSIALSCRNCFRSSLGSQIQHDTRSGMPYPAGGNMQSLSVDANGGILGGTASYQRFYGQFKAYTPLYVFGGGPLGGDGMVVTTGLEFRSGAIVGDPGPFFYSQAFSLGGTQYGETLRGYDEFSVTPHGYDESAVNGSVRRESFGNAFFAGTATLGLRISSSLFVGAFFEGGNVWNRPREFDPTRLFRSAGFGVSTQSPLGALGVDLGYGFDRVDAAGRPTPGWKLHFKLGQYF
jgi:outer membrane protein insertion porin family